MGLYFQYDMLGKAQSPTAPLPVSLCRRAGRNSRNTVRLLGRHPALWSRRKKRGIGSLQWEEHRTSQAFHVSDRDEMLRETEQATGWIFVRTLNILTGLLQRHRKFKACVAPMDGIMSADRRAAELLILFFLAHEIN